MTKQWKKMATVGAVFGDNLYSAGTTNFTAAQLKNANQAWNDVVSGGGKPADNATVGAIFGTNLYKTGTTNFTAAELKNEEIALGLSGTGLTLTNAGSGVTLSNSSVDLGNVANVDMRDLGNANAGTLVAARGGTGITNFANSTHANSNTTATNVGLGNVPNVDMRNLDNATGGTLAIARGGTALTSLSTLLNSGVSLSLSGTSLTLSGGGGSAQTFSSGSVGLGNVANVDMRNLDNATGGTLAIARGGTAATNSNGWLNTRVKVNADGTLAYDNTTSGAVTMNTLTDAGSIRSRITTGLTTTGVINTTVPTAKGGFGTSMAGASGAISFSSGTLSTGTLPVGVGGTGLTSTTTLLNANVTTFERDVSDIFWTNISGQMSPTATSYPITITWRNGAGTSLGTTVITVSLFSSTVLAAAVTTSNGASATISLGAQSNTNVLQSTTVTKNSIVCNVRAQIIDGSGWNFK